MAREKTNTNKYGRKKKKWIVLTIIIVAVLVGLVALILKIKKAGEELLAGMNSFDTEEVTVRDLTSSIGATGKIVSLETTDVNPEITSVKVDKVLVEVGDMVKAGDPLITFDMSDIEENLEDAQAALNRANQLSALSANAAAQSVADAQRNSINTLEDCQKKIKDLENDYEKQCNTYNDYREKREKLENAYKAAVAALPGYRVTLETKEAQLRANPGDAALIADVNTLNTQISAANETISTYTELKANETTWGDTANNTYFELEDAKKAYERTIAAQTSAITSAQNSQATNRLSNDTTSQRRNIEKLEEQLQSGTLTAPVSGMVTSVKAEAGQTVGAAAGALVVIQDVSSFEIESEISEYDISNLQIGQKVLIKTKATGDQSFTGKISKISPIATIQTNQLSSGSVTYTVRIKIDQPNEKLRLDMSASLSIITSEKKNAMTVPYNAVQTDDEGKTFVEVIDEGIDPETGLPASHTVYVNILSENNYYTEVSSPELHEGDKVKIIKTETNPMDMWMEFM
ncbi:MAG: efflux RND transporter periplasmic adaptor subunit [Lachnospiraceae bacterium]|nr:efflux RND transporter periplasmic adaptor subunit [Lachnospiraceae bacterium]